MYSHKTLLYVFIICLVYACKSPNGNAQHSEGQYRNHLANESSPYLLQHAGNPVDWYPWGEEALAKAKAEDKMLVISVGYAACHWCHVMEHESFEDTLVSQIMNENFVCIKVDREERPDIDDVYMTACQMATGKSCGWPLNAFALPDGRPVWAGTYFPKKDWMEVLNHFVKLHKEEPQKLDEYAEQLTSGIQANSGIEINTGDQVFTEDALQDIAKQFLTNVDFNRGGRKGAPKFPMPNNYQFLLNYHQIYGEEKALKAVTTTLDQMAMGGIYDQLGGGFARYSVDGEWKVPHFEKMLYDNGQLVSLYAQAFQVTSNPLYQKVVEETLAFIERELSDENGGFYSSLDADSEGEEGKFYVWQKEEIDQLLGEQSEVFCDYYEVTKKGNWEHKNILYRRRSAEWVAKRHNIEEAKVEEIVSAGQKTLLAARAERVRPGLDDKILTSWNALMLKGYADAYRAFGKPNYLQRALKNAQFIKQNMLQSDHRLNRNYKDSKSVINAFLDDYALLIDAYISLYQVTFDEQWLNQARDLADYTLAHFYESKNGMFNYTSDLDPPLVARKMELADNVIPGSNSTMARNLFHLGTYFYNTEYIDRAKQMMHNLSNDITSTDQPNFYSNWCSLYSSLVKPPYEVAIVGNDFEVLRSNLMKRYFPSALFLGGKDEGSLELLKDKLLEGETMIYVCQNKVCKLPVTEVEKAVGLID
ncbi:MAG: thioredoxin domain-containing protein [Bacteroidota bacterium]